MNFLLVLWWKLKIDHHLSFSFSLNTHQRRFFSLLISGILQFVLFMFDENKMSFKSHQKQFVSSRNKLQCLNRTLLFNLHIFKSPFLSRINLSKLHIKHSLHTTVYHYFSLFTCPESKQRNRTMGRIFNTHSESRGGWMEDGKDLPSLLSTSFVHHGKVLHRTQIKLFLKPND